MPAVRTYSKAPHFRPRASSLGSSPPSASFNPHFSVLKRQQVRCGNLSTVDHTSTPSHLSIFPYPVDSDGPPIAPKKLATYFKTHDIPQPVVCCCGSTCRFIRVRTARGMGERPVQSYLIPFNALAKTVSPLSSPAKYSDSSSEFSWSPIRRLLQMRASPTPAHDNDPFTNTNTGIGGAEANTAHFDYLGAASSRVKQESPSAEDHIVAMRADYKASPVSASTSLHHRRVSDLSTAPVTASCLYRPSLSEATTALIYGTRLQHTNLQRCLRQRQPRTLCRRRALRLKISGPHGSIAEGVSMSSRLPAWQNMFAIYLEL